jgi:hypothetical protein
MAETASWPTHAAKVITAIVSGQEGTAPVIEPEAVPCPKLPRSCYLLNESNTLVAMTGVASAHDSQSLM